ncbi:uncharacterized protein LOC135159909 [Diachasmimorpha longicaudata]|uniref:uncharacterized protein LOC135159909 n=1 Tax=Diachasmimorpha longicaudata TaxID=58733 RepID=UPI0030B8BF82
MPELSKLRRQRGHIIGAITHLKNAVVYYKALEAELQIPEKLQVAAVALKAKFAAFDDLQEQIETLDEAEKAKRFEIEGDYYDVIGEVTAIVSPLPRSRSVTSDIQRVPSPAGLAADTATSLLALMRLPELEIVKFNGEYENYRPFIDTFMSGINNYPQLSKFHKLQYFRSLLTGKAAKVIEALPNTENNYETALEMIDKKFNFERKILSRHWWTLQDLPIITKETPEALSNLVDTINQHLRSLKNLNQPVNQWDLPLICLIQSKISPELFTLWELKIKDSKLPTYTSLLEFLENRSQCSTRITSTINERSSHSKRGRQAFFTSETTCDMCKEGHKIGKCPKFRALSPAERYKIAKQKLLCINCLGAKHERQQCVSRFDCNHCHERHHTLLHFNDKSESRNPVNKSSTKPAVKPQAQPPMDSQSFIINTSNCDLMVTAQLQVINHSDQPVNCRALLDTCSTTNFMTERLALSLKLPTKNFVVPIGALNSMKTSTKHLVTATIRSRVSNFKKTLDFLTVPRISSLVPDQRLDHQCIKIPANLPLADPEFYQPGHIDMLLGCGTTLSMLGTSKRRLSSKDQPDLYLMQSALGSIIGGGVPVQQSSTSFSCHLTNIENLQFDLTKFWEIEEAVPESNSIQNECEQHFTANFSRSSTGRYVVALPFNEKISNLGESRSRAYHRFKACERKLLHNPELKTQYDAVLQEYLDLGHMTEVNTHNISHPGYYLPHHAVFKEGSLTTKLRVVFDASAKTNTGISLNDTLHVGPTIQDDILSLLLRFRLHQYVLTADIEKMYRQILVKPEDRKYQRILWRNDDGPVRTYELNTVTFGLSAAPYLAIRCLHQLATDEAQDFPIAAEILKRDMYVDDLLTGAETREHAIAIRDELTQLVKRGDFNLRQWASNDPSLLQDLAPDDINRHLLISDSPTLKTLGLCWNSTSDNIAYKVKSVEITAPITKRMVLSETAKIFDPLGLLAPVIIIAKTFIQRLWKLKLNWDSPLPADVQKEWQEFYQQLPVLQEFQHPRKALTQLVQRIELHGFCDASNLAYGACIYVKSISTTGTTQVSLLCAKSRVAPLTNKPFSPRLELCGALLLARLMTNVRNIIHIQIQRVNYWTDSTVVLHWLHTPSTKLLPYVANRVSEIQQMTLISDWKHVRTHENPADLKEGPAWLLEDEHHWPILDLHFPSDPPELKKQQSSPQAGTCFMTAMEQRSGNALTWYSSLTKLQRIIAHCRRFLTRNKGPIAVEEMDSALHGITYWVQRETFTPVITLLHKKNPGQKAAVLAPLAKLNPFLDERAVIRVGGRLRNSNVPYSQRHPMILPKKHHVTNLVIHQEHHRQLHAGAQATLSAVRLRFWIPDGRSTVRHLISSCVRCIRHRPPPVNYIMGSLPATRVTESRPFNNVGIDYCGPFFIKEKKFRNRARIKVWVAVFVCLAVKAVHLEIVSDLTTEAFLSAFRRFIGRRGLCDNVYSDNGTCFVGANNELRELHDFLQNEDHQRKIQSFAAIKSIRWHFIPPQSPHCGGLWEAAVKSFKIHLKRIVTDELLTFEQLNTLVIEIEAVLNSRPLTPLSSDPNDLQALTPGHFLIGAALTALRGPDFRETPSNRLSSWQHLQKLKQHFWTRWHREYISELNLRNKWANGEHPITAGTIVLLKEDNLPPQQWAMGRVIQIHPGADGIIRTVSIKTPKGTLKRNVKKLAPLITNDDEKT